MFAACLVSMAFAAGADRLPAGHPLRAVGLVAVPRGGTWTMSVGLEAGRVVVRGPLPTTRAAAAELEARLAELPDDADGWEELAGVREMLGRPDLAAAARERAVTVARTAAAAAPNDPEKRGGLAAALCRAGHPKEAQAEADAAVALAPDAFPALFCRAWVRHKTGHADAAAALAAARAKLPADDTESRAGLAALAVQLALDRTTDEATRAAALADADAAIRAAADGPAVAPDRRLALLLTRDLLRLKADPAGAALPAETLDLVRRLVPADAADPAVPFGAVFVELFALKTAGGEGKPAMDRFRAAAAPYLDSLARLGRSRDPATAAAALFFRGMAVQFTRADEPDAAAVGAADYRAAVAIDPAFEAAWSALAEATDGPGQAAVYRDWLRAARSPLARYMLVRHHADANDWATAAAVLAEDLASGCPRLELCRAACELRNKPVDGLARLDAVRRRTPVEPDMAGHLERLTALGLLLAGRPAEGKAAADAYRQWAADRDDEARADARRVRELFGP